MKKILLLLSCFLATWCSVQAGTKASTSSDMMQSSSLLAGAYDADGQIKSATYDANYSEIHVTYSLRNASNAKLGLLSTRTGGIVGEYSLGVNATTKSCRIDSRINEGLYVLLLYVNGNIRSNMNVTITAKGSIKSFSPSLDNKNLTVSYALEHASAYGASLRIFDGTTQVKKVNLTTTFATNSVTFDSSSLKTGKKYTFKLYSDENELKPGKDYTIPSLTGGLTGARYWSGSNSVDVDYNLKYARNPTIGIYDESGKNLLKSVAITNSSTTKCVSIYDAVEPNKTYQAYICENGVKTSMHYTFDTNDKVDKIVALKYNGRIVVDFTLKKTGNVGFKLISTRTGRTYDYNFGYCGQYNGTYNLTIPSDDNGYHGSIIYVVLLTVDGKVVDNKQIAVSR